MQRTPSGMVPRANGEEADEFPFPRDRAVAPPQLTLPHRLMEDFKISREATHSVKSPDFGVFATTSRKADLLAGPKGQL